MNIYIFPEGSCVIPNKVSYVDDATCSKVVKVVAPVIIKIKVSKVDFILPILFSISLTLYLYTYKLSEDDMRSPSVVGIPNI